MLNRNYDEQIANPAISLEEAERLNKEALRKQALEALIQSQGALPEVDEANRLNALPNSEMNPDVEVPLEPDTPMQQEDRMRRMQRYQQLFGPKD